MVLSSKFGKIVKKKQFYVCEGTASVLHKCCSLFIEAVLKERHFCWLERMSGFRRQSRQKRLALQGLWESFPPTTGRA